MPRFTYDRGTFETEAAVTFEDVHGDRYVSHEPVPTEGYIVRDTRLSRDVAIIMHVVDAEHIVAALNAQEAAR